MQIITRLKPGKFKVVTSDVPGSELELDFNPIIEAKNLTGDYMIIHWQAKPKGDRKWGIYSSWDDAYRSTLAGQINMSNVEMFQLDDKTAKSIPSAVLITAGNSINCINGKTIIGEVYLSDLLN